MDASSPMEIDKKQLREFVLWLLEAMEKTENDLVAHGLVFELLKATGQYPKLDAMLEMARKNPSPAMLTRQKKLRETIEQLLTEENQAEVLLRFLQKWKPQGPIQ